MASLFERQSIEQYFRPFWAQLESAINKIPATEVVALDSTKVGVEMASKFHVECPVLSQDISCSEPLSDPDNSDFLLSAHVPFTGDAELFHYYGSSHPLIYENIYVGADELVISLRTNRHQLHTFKDSVRAIVARIEEGLKPIRDMIPHLQRELRDKATALIRKRQHDVASHAALLNQVKTVGFPVRKREDAKQSVFVPVQPKKIELRPQPTPAKPTPEPELALNDYDEILRVIQNMVTVFERSPSVFRTMEEEHLRTILLVGLNGVFEGGATGETFNGEGKTDILIRASNKNIFIAECLIWDGAEHFKAKLTNQLFKYATWRDSKLAAIVFNRRKNFTDVVQKMRETVSALANKSAELSCPFSTACRYRFCREDDAQKQFLLTCLAFDVPS